VALVRPVVPKDNCCRAGRAVKFIEVRVESEFIESSDNTVNPPSERPPIDLRSPNDKLASVTAFWTVKLPVIACTPLTDKDVCPLPSGASVKSVGIATEPLYVVHDANGTASADLEMVNVALLLHCAVRKQVSN